MRLKSKQSHASPRPEPACLGWSCERRECCLAGAAGVQPAKRPGAMLGQVRGEILDLVNRCDSETGSRRVLVDRLRGMEDSSRYWSVFMTLDHLRIVNVSIADTIRSLSAGKIPAREARTADVKPSPLADASVVPEFEQSCDEIERSVADFADLRTAVKFAHPWFGPLDAESWYFLSAFHMRLHFAQITAIYGALNAAATR